MRTQEWYEQIDARMTPRMRRVLQILYFADRIGVRSVPRWILLRYETEIIKLQALGLIETISH